MAIDSSAPAATGGTGPGAAEDLSALAWVQDELRRSLDLAHKALRRYLKEQAQKSDLDGVDPAVLRQARNQLHQCVGVLELVGLGPAAELPRAAEAALQRISARPKLVTPAAVDTLERGSFALLDFIARRLAAKPVPALALFPQYKALQELAGALRVHPADLWEQPWSWRDLPRDTLAAPRHPDDGTTAQVEADLLALMRGATHQVAARMADVFAGLAAGAQALADSGDAAAHAPHSRLATLWQLAAGFFEAQADGLLEPDAYSKRLGSKLLAQLRAGETAEPSERLAHDLLFFCAQADISGGRLAGPRLAAVRRAYGLRDGVPVDYIQPSLGRFDPAWVAQARKRVGGAKEVWSAVAGGDLARRDSLAEQFALVGDSLNKLYADGAMLARALQDSAAQAAASETEPPADLAMEVATALLYLEASIDDADYDRAGSGRRVQRLAQRIDAVREGRDPGTLDLWMEELYRRVSDRQTIGSVVQELRAALSEVEKNIDQYFRNPAQRELLIPVPGQLQAMRGVLSVLGLDQASQAVLRMRDDVDALANTEVDARHAIGHGTFERLADNLGALSFLIDMVSVQPAMAKSLFQFDPVTGNLRAVMAREPRPTGFDEFDTRPGEAPPVSQDTDALAVALEFERIVEKAGGPRTVIRADRPGAPVPAQAPLLADAPLLDLLPLDDTLLPASGLTSAPAPLPVDRRTNGDDGGDTLTFRLDGAPTLALPTLPMDMLAPVPAAPLAPPAAPQPMPAPAAPVSSGLEDDPEMREIFLEEAADVLTGAREALAALHQHPEDTEAMTTVRRAFHTLKGSARMVGLLPFGEAAWACEQLYNARLAARTPADGDLLRFSDEVCARFGGWVQALTDGDASAHTPEAIVRAADALRTEGRRLPLEDAATPSAAAVAVVPADLPTDLPADLDLPDLALEPLPLAGPPSAPVDAAVADLRLRVPDLPLAADLDLSATDDTAPPLPDIPLAGLDGAEDLPGLPALAPEPPAADLQALPDALVPADMPEAVEIDLGDDLALAFGVATAPADVPDADTPVRDAPPTDSPVDLAADTVLADALPAAPAAADAPAEASPASMADVEPVDDEAVRQIGPLRISIPLFNIYLNEADELSRRLGVALAEWALEQQRPVGDTAVALAHSLAGSSGTVGFTDLAQLSRALEHALERTQARGHGAGDEAALYDQAADEIRRLLHLFAAGFLQAPDPDLVVRLQALAHAGPVVQPEPGVDLADDVAGEATELLDLPLDEVALPAAGPVSESFTDADADADADVDADPVAAPAGPVGAVAPTAPPAAAEPSDSAEPVVDSGPGPVDGPGADTPAPEAAPQTEAVPSAADTVVAPLTEPDPALAGLGRAALLPFSALASLPADAPVAAADDSTGNIDEDIDAVDALDDELLPIFAEETQELLPVLHAGLRDWARAPGDGAAASACMRCLHTFKGSARLAGAMRLGEMAHRLETLVQRLAASATPAAPDAIDALAAQADLLQTRLDALLRPGAASAAPGVVPAATPTAAAVTAPAPAPAPAAPVPAAGSATPVAAPAPAPTPAPTPASTPVPPARTVAAPAPAPVLRLVPPIDWQRFAQPAPHAGADLPAPVAPATAASAASAAAAGSVRVRTPLLDRLVNQAGEVSIARARIESDVHQVKGALHDLSDNLERLRAQLRDIELQAETQIETRMEAARAAAQAFDPLELDRFTRFQELTRMMAESVADVATVQRGLQRTLQSTEDALAHQARMNRDMQDDLLRTRMVEFEGLSERLYRVVRQAAKETGKPVRLDILGGRVEIDRGVLDRMTPAFEHLLRNSVVHGIEPADVRAAAGKDAVGTVTLAVTQVGNEVGVEVRDDGGGLHLPRILDKARALGLVAADAVLDDAALANLIFQPGFTTADSLTGLAGRGVGMDVVRTEVNAMGGRIETASAPGQGTSFRLVLPLTTAVTQVVMLRCGERAFAVPSTLVEIVRRIKLPELAQAYQAGSFAEGGQALPFFWFDALLGGSARGTPAGRSATVVVIRSAQQRVVLHVDEVQGNQEVVVKNLGPQLSRVPGLVGMTLLPSGLPALIYNPVALATLYGVRARAATESALAAAEAAAGTVQAAAQPLAPLVLVVDDSLTVRRITQRLLEREGYRVAVAKDGLDGLEKLAAERPAVLLTDIEMPRMDGFDLVRNLRNDAALDGLPIIMITSRIAQKHRDVAAELGVDHYLGKPYAEDELLALVARHARGAAALVPA